MTARHQQLLNLVRKTACAAAIVAGLVVCVRGFYLERPKLVATGCGLAGAGIAALVSTWRGGGQ